MTSLATGTMAMDWQTDESGPRPQDHDDDLEERVSSSQKLSDPEDLNFTADKNSTEMVVPAPLSQVSIARTSEDDKKFWGGKMVDSVIANEGNISLFSDDCLAIHGLYSAFYSKNGWGRTIVYLGYWLLVGCFFVYLTVPLVNDYDKKTVSTSVDFVEGATIGLPLPIITVCPHGSGYRCDCLLWRKMYCRYLEDVPNTQWRDRFVTYTCLSQYERTSDGDLVWIDPQCDKLDNKTDPFVDPCLPSRDEKLSLPALGNITTEFLFETVISRENLTNGPYISYGELALYASHRVQAIFYRGMSNPLRRLDSIILPRDYVNDLYFDPSRRQICTQFRAPYSEKQTTAGSMNGINVIVSHLTTDLYPLGDIDVSSPAVDIHINVVEEKLYGEQYLYVEPHKFTPVPAGMVTSISYGAVDFTRVKGWGPMESRSCQDTVVPRSSCVTKVVLDNAGEQCKCLKPQNISPAYDLLGETSIYWCSSSVGTSQNECVEDIMAGENQVPLDQCPVQCRSTQAQLSRIIQTTLSESQTDFIRTMNEVFNPSRAPASVKASIVKEESAIIHIGVESLFRNKYEQSPKVALAALLGQVGGNAGLWCGLSFVMMLETLEFVLVALLYGGGFYSGGRVTLRERIKRLLTRRS